MSRNSSHTDAFLASFWQTLECVPLVSLDQLLHSSFGQAVPAAGQRQRRKLLRSILHRANATVCTVDGFVPVAVERNGQPLLDSRDVFPYELQHAVRPDSTLSKRLKDRLARFEQLKRQSTRRTAVYYSKKTLIVIPRGLGSSGNPFEGVPTGEYERLSTCLGLAGFFLHHLPTEAKSTWQLETVYRVEDGGGWPDRGLWPSNGPEYLMAQYSTFCTLADGTLAKYPDRHRVYTNPYITAMDLKSLVHDNYVTPNQTGHATTAFEIW